MTLTAALVVLLATTHSLSLSVVPRLPCYALIYPPTFQSIFFLHVFFSAFPHFFVKLITQLAVVIR